MKMFPAFALTEIAKENSDGPCHEAALINNPCTHCVKKLET